MKIADAMRSLFASRPSVLADAAKTLRELIDAPFPCGWPESSVSPTGQIEFLDASMTVEEARGIVADLIRSIDAAEERANGRR